MEKVYEEIFGAIEKKAQVGGWWVNIRTNEVGWTDGTRRIHDAPSDFQPSFDQAIEFYLPDFRDAVASAVGQASTDGKPFNFNAQIKTFTGAIKWVNSYGLAHIDDDEALYLFGAFVDIDQQVKQKEMLSIAERRNVITTNSLLEGVVSIDKLGRIEAFNKAAERMFGYSEADVMGKFVDILMPEDPHGKNHHNYINSYISTGINKIIGIGRELEAVKRDGVLFPIKLSVNKIEQGGDIGFVGTIHDLSKEKEYADRLKWATLYDEITGLPNRSFLVEYLSEVSFADGVTLVALDIDGFSRINLVNGYEEGNVVLLEASRRISELIGDDHVLARDLADRFWLCVDGREKMSKEAVRSLIQNIFDSIKKPIGGREEEYFIQMTAGVSDGLQADSAFMLISQAETALYEGKDNSRGGVNYYKKKDLDDIIFEYKLENNIRTAIKDKAIECWLQPKVDQDGRIVSAEVLSRWILDGEFVPPDLFVKVSEKSGLIDELGEYIANKTALMLKKLNEVDPKFSLAMNVSPRQFLSDGFEERVKSIFLGHKANLSNLTIEITENLLINNTRRVDLIMQSFIKDGVDISLDDFGTGYSNLKRIMELPISEIKIDRSFIMDVLESEKSSSVVLSICQIARSLKASVVAEGVENEEVSSWCRSNNVTYQQGYYFSKPVPFNEFLRLL